MSTSEDMPADGGTPMQSGMSTGDDVPMRGGTSTGDDKPVAGSPPKGDGAADAPQITERIRYVEVSPTGWPTMAKAVRDLDVEKVQDYKEDIDTLLVFAGLYSAVLSAFLLVAYTYLLPDNDGQMVYLLQQIAAQTQSYTLVAGHLNTTALPQNPPSTAIPRWAVHVNALWFASLIISLSVASYGMLVKQWLREYLAMDYTAPQERLRARQYRRPSLDNWKVFEIASALPILLQISLGLFFVGICIFTNSFNDEIAHLSLPLVCAWAAFFVFAALAPLMSPRCPYKTPFLKGLLKRGRMLTFAQEEEVFVQREQDDAAILLDTDKAMADDNFIPMMLDIYRPYTRTHPEQGFKFALSLLSRCSGGMHLETPLHVIPSLSAVSRKAYESILDFVAEIVDSAGINLTPGRPAWQLDASLLFLAESLHPPTDHIQMVRHKLLANRPADIISTVMGHAKYEACPSLWQALCTLGPFSGLSGLFNFYDEVFKVVRNNSSTSSPSSLYAALHQKAKLTSNALRPVLRHLLDEIMNETTKSDQQVVSGCQHLDPIFVESRLIILDFAPMAYTQSEYDNVLQKAWRHEPTNAVFLIHGYCSMWLHLSDSEQEKRYQQFYEHVYGEDGWTDVLKTLTHVIEMHTESFGADPSQAPINMLHCCTFFLHFHSLNDEWHRLLEALAIGLRWYYENRAWEKAWTPLPFMLHNPSSQVRTVNDIVTGDRNLADECLKRIADLKNRPYSGPWYIQNIPDALVDALHLFTSMQWQNLRLPENIAGADTSIPAAPSGVLQETQPSRSLSDSEDTTQARKPSDQSVPSRNLE